MKKFSGFLYLVPFILVILAVTGYVKNIIHLSECDFEPSYKAEVIYAVGIIPVVGVFTGWMDFGK